MKLTLAGKVVIFLVIVGLAALGYFYNKDKWFGEGGGDSGIETGDLAGLASPPDGAVLDTTDGPLGTAELGRTLKVAINTWVGHAGAIVANGGLSQSDDSIYKTKYGIDVELILIESPDPEKKAALVSGKVDLMWDTVDTWAAEAPLIGEAAQMHPKAVILQDWSRGGDGIVSSKSINSIEDLRGKKVALAKFTPSHFLLLYLLSQSNLSGDDISGIRNQLVFMDDAPKSAQAFIAGQVDAAVTWEPDLTIAAEQADGHKLTTTATATNIIADVLVASPEAIEKGPQTVLKFIEGYLEGVAETKNSPGKANSIIGKALSLPTEEIEGMLSGVKLTEYGDNAEFFGLTQRANQFEKLFEAASRIWRKEGVITSAAKASDTFDNRFIAALKDKYPDAGVSEDFDFSEAPASDAEPLMTKTTKIHFQSNSAEISEDSRYILDDFAETLTSIGNAYVRIEGNTDSVGDAAYNRRLSKQRAKAVQDYFVGTHHFDARRFTVIGNGEDKPVAGNETEEGREKNRRTEFFLIANE